MKNVKQHINQKKGLWMLLIVWLFAGCNTPEEVPIPDRFYLVRSNCFGVMQSRSDTSFQAELICDEFHYKTLRRSQNWIIEEDGDQVRRFKIAELNDSLGAISKALPLRRDRFKQHLDTLNRRITRIEDGKRMEAYTLRYSMWVDITDRFILEDSIEVVDFSADESLIVYQPSTGEEVFLVMSDGGIIEYEKEIYDSHGELVGTEIWRDTIHQMKDFRNINTPQDESSISSDSASADTLNP